MEFQQLLEIALSFGQWVLFAWFFFDERKRHDNTRQRHMDDLREIAGLRRNLPPGQTYVPDARHVPVESEMRASGD